MDGHSRLRARLIRVIVKLYERIILKFNYGDGIWRHLYVAKVSASSTVHSGWSCWNRRGLCGDGVGVGLGEVVPTGNAWVFKGYYTPLTILSRALRAVTFQMTPFFASDERITSVDSPCLDPLPRNLCCAPGNASTWRV